MIVASSVLGKSLLNGITSSARRFVLLLNCSANSIFSLIQFIIDPVTHYNNSKIIHHFIIHSLHHSIILSFNH